MKGRSPDLYLLVPLDKYTTKATDLIFVLLASLQPTGTYNAYIMDLPLCSISFF